MRRLLAFVAGSAMFISAFGIAAPAAAQRTQGNLPVEIVPLLPHQNVRQAAFSPDGLRVITAGDKAVKLWDMATGRLLRTFTGHSDEVLSVAFSPDGVRVLSGSSDKTLKLWDAASGNLLRTFEGHTVDSGPRANGDGVRSVAFSPDGTRVVSGGSDNTIRLWDAASGQLLRTFTAYPSGVFSVAFSPDGTQLLSRGGDVSIEEAGPGTLHDQMPGINKRTKLQFLHIRIKLWDAATGRLLRTFGDQVSSGVLSPDGTRIAAGSNREKTIMLWNAATGQLLRAFDGHSNSVNSVTFSPDGARMLSGSSDKTMKLWDVATGQLLRTFSGYASSVGEVAFSPDGSRVLSAVGNEMRVWDADTGALIRTLGGPSRSASQIRLAPDGARLLGNSGDLWDVANGQHLRTFAGMAGPVAFSPDGVVVLSSGGDNALMLLDATTGKLLRRFMGHSGFVNSVAFSPEGTRVLSGSNDKTMKLWDAATGNLLRTFEGHTGGSRWEGVTSVTFSPDGLRVLSGGSDKTMKLWDAASGQLVRNFAGLSDWVHSVAFSRDGSRIISGIGDKILIWDAGTGRMLRTLVGHSNSVWSVAVSPDGARVLSGSIDKTIRLWDATTGAPLRIFTGHSDSAWSVAWSPRGDTLFSASYDRTIKVWNVNTGEVLVTLMSSADGEWLAITPEGFFVASKKGAELLTVVRGFEVYSIDQLFQSLYRPDLIREKLAGDPKGLVREAASKLDLNQVIASGNAPVVRILSPKEGERVATEQVTAEADISDRGGGIGRIEWRVNGLTLGVETRGLARADVATAVKRALFLEPGDNVVEVVAYNAKGLIASTPASIRVVREGGPPTRPHLHVLAVGVNDYYDSRLQLTFAVPDAKALGEALRKAGDKIYDNAEITTILDADVTTVNLDRVFTEVAKNVRPSDVFVFFLAGHGKTVDGRYYFLPQDFRYQGEESISQRGVGQDRWQEWFARIPARKSILLYDTCESGTLTGDRVAQRGLERVAALDRMTQAMGRTVLTASTDDAPALEGYRGHGVFTYVLLDALGRADTNRNGLIEVTELAAFVDQQVPELSFQAFHMRQVPQMRIVGSNFPLANQIVVLPSAGEASAPVIPSKPTHVVSTAADVFADTTPGGVSIRRLDAGTGVTLVKTGAGWTLIAREGKILGYVATTDLLPIQ